MTGPVQYLATIPSPTQGVWNLGPIPIRAYALFIILGIVAACAITEYRLRQRGAPKWLVLDMALYAVPFGLIGGRLYHVITDPELYFARGRHPIEALYIWQGGLGIWGAVALGAFGAWLGCRRAGIPLGLLADALAPGLPVAQAVGRLGNYFNNELYGSHTNLPWGLVVYQWDLSAGRPEVDPVTGQRLLVSGGPFHPTFLYELLWDLGVAVLVYLVDRRYRLGRGRAFALYVAAYTVGRFWIEALRIDTANHFLGVRLNDWVSLLVLAGAVAYLVRIKGPQQHMRVDEDGTVHIVTADGTPIQRYPAVNPGSDDPEGASRNDWVATARARTREAWASVTSRWSGADDEDEDQRGERQRENQK
ncbi:MAG TPA: prolipoprotein diacylglyceryl transferase [Micromonosporaceae bacterium]|jgi:prolipoprotein diacylglyceryl transferase